MLPARQHHVQQAQDERGRRDGSGGGVHQAHIIMDFFHYVRRILRLLSIVTILVDLIPLWTTPLD